MNAPIASTGTGSRILDDVAQVVGGSAAFALALEFRGQGFYVPLDPANAPRIKKAIGADLTKQFCAAFWQLTLDLPFREAIRREAHRLAACGETKREIAQRLHIAERQVYRLLESPARGDGPADRASDDRQIEMF